MKKLVLLFLLLATSGLAQLIPVSSLPTLEPAIPPAPTSTSSPNDRQRWVWGNWYYQDDQKNRALVTQLASANRSLTDENIRLNAVVSTLKGQTASVDLSPVIERLDALKTFPAFMVRPVPAPTNTTAEVTPAGNVVRWDYTEDPNQPINGFRIARSSDNGESWILLPIISDTSARTFTDKISSDTVAGVYYLYRVTAYARGGTFVAFPPAESVPAPVVAVNPPNG